MHVDVRQAEDVIIVDFEGPLVAGLGDEILRKVMDEVVGSGWQKILLNLSGVSRIDSAGIGELVASIKLAERFGSSVKLLNLAPQVQKVLNLTQILPLLDFYEDEEEALRQFRSSSPTEGSEST